MVSRNWAAIWLRLVTPEDIIPPLALGLVKHGCALGSGYRRGADVASTAGHLRRRMVASKARSPPKPSLPGNFGCCRSIADWASATIVSRPSPDRATGICGSGSFWPGRKSWRPNRRLSDENPCGDHDRRRSPPSFPVPDCCNDEYPRDDLLVPPDPFMRREQRGPLRTVLHRAAPMWPPTSATTAGEGSAHDGSVSV